MSTPTQPGQEFEPVSLEAFNFAEDSDNRIHADDVAATYGFRGGLVPGVADYAYMTVPVVKALGAEWIRHGYMHGKFIKPVYHRETIQAQATVITDRPLSIETRIANSEGIVCAVGRAAELEKTHTVNVGAYPWKAPLEESARVDATTEIVPEGMTLGSLDWTYSWAADGPEFLDKVVEPLELYRSAGAPWHPAYLTYRGNDILMANVALGPWIHTESEAWRLDLPHEGEPVSLRGKVAKSFEKRGHRFVTLDLVFLGEGERLLAHLLHHAIVRPAQNE